MRGRVAAWKLLVSPGGGFAGLLARWKRVMLAGLVARISLVFPPLQLSREFIDYPYFADLGAVQAAAVLRACGHRVTLSDALAMSGAGLEPLDDGRIYLGAPSQSLDTDAGSDVLIVAYTPFHRPPERDAALGALLARLRERHPECPILLADLYQSGQHVVDAASADIARAYPEVDAILRYEAEAALPEVVAQLARGGRPASQLLLTGQELPDLDSLPLPAWDLIDVGAYFRFHEQVMSLLGRPHWAFPIDGPSLPLLTTRGCPYRCAHCSSNPGRQPGSPKRQRRYSAEYLARHIEYLVSLGARRVHVLDELANVNERHFDGLLGEICRHELKLEIPNGLRADHVTAEHLERLAGRLTTLSVSAESGVQRVVDEVVGKDLELSAIRRVCERAQAAGVPALVHFMIGLPGETKAEINATLHYALTLHQETDAFPSVQFATPLPGTRLAAMAARRHVALPLASDWGPRFQHAPSFGTEDFTRAELETFKRTFDARIAASQGPKKVILNVTYKCNNRCTFCAVGTRTQVDGNFERQREFLLKYRRQGVTLLDIDGGEPTLNPKLFPLIRFARRAGYQRINVTTNGRMCTYEDYARGLVGSGVTSVLFSIHGSDARMHAASVGVMDAFEQTLGGVRNCVRLAGPEVELGANITLTKTNYAHLGEVAELVHGLGLRWMNIQFLTPFGRATRTVCPDTQAAADVAMRVIDDWGASMKFQVINLPFCFMPGYERYLVGDLLKLERHMIFVNNEEVNLFEYLREQRHFVEDQCSPCPHRTFCGGFYELDDVPEPPWLISPEDLVRPIARTGLTPSPAELPAKSKALATE